MSKPILLFLVMPLIFIAGCAADKTAPDSTVDTIIGRWQITIIGRGGHREDNCGGYDESARSFPLKHFL